MALLPLCLCYIASTAASGNYSRMSCSWEHAREKHGLVIAHGRVAAKKPVLGVKRISHGILCHEHTVAPSRAALGEKLARLVALLAVRIRRLKRDWKLAPDPLGQVGVKLAELGTVVREEAANVLEDKLLLCEIEHTVAILVQQLNCFGVLTARHAGSLEVVKHSGEIQTKVEVAKHKYPRAVIHLVDTLALNNAKGVHAALSIHSLGGSKHVGGIVEEVHVDQIDRARAKCPARAHEALARPSLVVEARLKLLLVAEDRVVGVLRGVARRQRNKLGPGKVPNLDIFDVFVHEIERAEGRKARGWIVSPVKEGQRARKVGHGRVRENGTHKGVDLLHVFLPVLAANLLQVQRNKARPLLRHQRSKLAQPVRHELGRLLEDAAHVGRHQQHRHCTVLLDTHCVSCCCCCCAACCCATVAATLGGGWNMGA
eukprot:m.294700 g.294700  ORF g.294700 m.294700 type:complete len:429 (+) comp13045_c0_seq1:327-1613(+)